MSYRRERSKTERESVVAPAAERVPRQTAPHLNAQIRREMEMRVVHCAARLDEIDQRLHELDREWDVERTLEANAATLSLVGLILGARSGKRWHLLPLVVASFLLQHAVQGWCPPLPILRRLGFRTRAEIDHERYALKALRGDFEGVPANSEKDPSARAEAALSAATC